MGQRVSASAATLAAMLVPVSLAKPPVNKLVEEKVVGFPVK